MSKEAPRMRMFAGPNGSGKSTLKTIIRPDIVGMYINPDEIEKNISNNGNIDLNYYDISASTDEFLNFFDKSSLSKKTHYLTTENNIKINDNKIIFSNIENNSYIASIIADFIRQKLIDNLRSFTFETVMSFSDKIDLFNKARHMGYRTYLYYVATEDPTINISRVKHRVSTGGHPVPEDKIISRYHRSLELLMDAVKVSNRAYIFDNSGCEQIWLAEITDGHMLEMKTDNIPGWFKTSILDKLNRI